MAERKRFIDVQIPILDSELRVLGTLEDLNKKTIKLDLTRKLRGKGLTIKFRIFNYKNKLIAIPNRLELVKSYIRRIMRKRVDYVEDSFKTSCKDIRVTIKPFLITRKKVSRAVRKNLRNTTKEFANEASPLNACFKDLPCACNEGYCGFRKNNTFYKCISEVEGLELEKYINSLVNQSNSTG